MAFPFVSEEGFELGTLGHFDVTVDTESKLSFPSFAELSRFGNLKTAPFRGAHCMKVDLSLGIKEAYIEETGDWDMTTGSAELYGRFMFYITGDITMANADEFSIFEFWASTTVEEAGFFLNFTTANGLRLGIGKVTAAQFLPISTNMWHAVEFFFNPAGSGNGTFDAWLDRVAFTQVASLTNASITSGVVGAFDHGRDTDSIPAGTTAGVLLFDEIITDDARVFPPNERFPEEILMTKSGHAFIGGGEINNITLMDGGSGNSVVSVYDTDTGNTDDASAIVVELKSTANNETVDPAGMPVLVRRGCYVALSGTNPRALVQIKRAKAYHSDASIRSYGRKRKALAGGV